MVRRTFLQTFWKVLRSSPWGDLETYISGQVGAAEGHRGGAEGRGKGPGAEAEGGRQREGAEFPGGWGEVQRGGVRGKETSEEDKACELVADADRYDFGGSEK